ncbi:uncharacterized protein BDZ99DRAFT_562379 [Mytilinidion resinicola]|uniref:Nudix hydrolase domain-containing protein n=1 Tax=Mytilinidion resinicola TaxID=574789 RepID=A0A6A6YR58_9PEZI|nr:uncharacterized protein BDZ99DRAFT_562379 [Mytilinidion resinicola]KAF2811270.1 hypothetical protein BDZ99DRAFT_562379 [Mytilinidion resinicola]
MSREEFRQTHVSLSGRRYDKVVVGAAVLHPSSHAEGSPKLLLLKRAPHETSYPNLFELPGGKVDEEDISPRIVAEFEPFEYTLEKVTKQADGTEVTEEKSSYQLNFLVEVSGSEVIMNPEEHSESAWVTEQEVGPYPMSDGMRKVVANAFRRAEEVLKMYM